jgi:hypothetical protein
MAVSDMFRMTVEDAINIHDNLVTIGRPCENSSEFAGRLVDSLGNVYDAERPMFTRSFVEDDPNVIMLGVFGLHKADTFMGKELYGHQ